MTNLWSRTSLKILQFLIFASERLTCRKWLIRYGQAPSAWMPRGFKASIVYNNGNYSAPYENLYLLVLFRFSRPCRICKDMESIFVYRRTKLSTGIHNMVDTLYAPSLNTWKAQQSNNIKRHTMLSVSSQNVVLCRVSGVLSMAYWEKHVGPPISSNYWTAVTSERMESSSSQLSYLTGFLVVCLAQ